MSRNVVHHSIDSGTNDQEIKNLRQICVVQPFQNISFRTHVHPSGSIVFDPLDDHLLLKTQMIAEINNSRPAFSDFPDNLIDTVNNISVLQHTSLLPVACSYSQ